MGILVVKWKLNFLSKEKLCDMWSNPLPGIYHLQVLMYLRRIVLMSYSVSKNENKWEKENLQILDLQWWKAMYKSERT